ncbi:hypothetical protein SAMN06265347_110114 [Halobellus salinus]|nr:hypothetical protein SAMN06265347_110114 [Halobellus salinus]
MIFFFAFNCCSNKLSKEWNPVSRKLSFYIQSGLKMFSSGLIPSVYLRNFLSFGIMERNPSRLRFF